MALLTQHLHIAILGILTNKSMNQISRKFNLNWSSIGFNNIKLLISLSNKVTQIYNFKILTFKKIKQLGFSSNVHLISIIHVNSFSDAYIYLHVHPMWSSKRENVMGDWLKLNCVDNVLKKHRPFPGLCYGTVGRDPQFTKRFDFCFLIWCVL